MQRASKPAEMKLALTMLTTVEVGMRMLCYENEWVSMMMMVMAEEEV